MKVLSQPNETIYGIQLAASGAIILMATSQDRWTWALTTKDILLVIWIFLITILVWRKASWLRKELPGVGVTPLILWIGLWKLLGSQKLMELKILSDALPLLPVAVNISLLRYLAYPTRTNSSEEEYEDIELQDGRSEDIEDQTGREYHERWPSTMCNLMTLIGWSTNPFAMGRRSGHQPRRQEEDQTPSAALDFPAVSLEQ